MDGASLSTLLMPQGLAGAGLLPGTAPAIDAARAGFAALLGATELAGLSAEQQAALSTLLSDPAGALVPAPEAGGKIAPPPAIVDLLNALGVDLNRVLAGGRDSAMPAADGVEARDAVQELGAALLSLLEPVLPRDGQASEPVPSEDSLIASLPAADPPRASAPPILNPFPVLPVPAQDVATAEAPALSVHLPQAQRAPLPDTPRGAVPEVSVDADAPTIPARAALPPGDDLATALAVAATGQGAVRARTPAEPLAGMQVLLDADAALPGRAGLAAAPDVVPGRLAAPATDGVAVPVGERGWERAFAERVVWLVGQQIHAAEVKLNPPHLGPVEVRLALNGQEASVSFTVAHGAVRDAVEQAIPRLREMFAEQNLQIVNVNVGQRDASNQASAGDRHGNASASPGRPVVAAATEHAAPRRRESSLPGLVDEYA